MVDPGSTHICLVKTGAPLRPMAEGIGCNFLLTNQSTLPPVKAAAMASFSSPRVQSQ